MGNAKASVAGRVTVQFPRFFISAQTEIAVLTHDGKPQLFYGINALIKAHDAAQNGDNIMLSSGSFNPPTITTAIEIEGAGFCTDAVFANTILSGNIILNMKETFRKIDN